MWIKTVLSIIWFFIQKWMEKDAEKKKTNEEIANEIGEAFKESDKDIRASRLSAVITRMRR